MNLPSINSVNPLHFRKNNRTLQSPIETAFDFGFQHGLRGVLTQPRETQTPDRQSIKKKPVALFFNAGVLHHVGPFRLWVDLARELAKLGFCSLRFDLMGLGDSGGVIDSTNDLNFSAIRDISSAMNAVESRLGSSDFILFGLCSGADYGHPALKADARIRGAVFIDPYGYRTIAYYFNQLTSKVFNFRKLKNFILNRVHLLFQRTINRFATDGLDALPALQTADSREFPAQKDAENDILRFLDEGRKLFYVYTAGVPDYYSSRRQFWQMFPRLQKQASKAISNGQLRYEYYGKTDHTFALVSDRRQLMDAIIEFVGNEKN